MEDGSETEVERIRAAYRERDAAAPSLSPWSDDGYRRRMQELERALLELMVAAGRDPLGARVLEVGCGSGYFLSRFLDYGAAHAAGIDLMENRAEAARRRDPRLEVVAGDAARLPWDDGAFDVVSQFTCLSSVLDARLRSAIAAEMRRVLAPDGLIVSYDMSGAPPAVQAFRRAAALRRRVRPAGAGTATVPIPAAELARLFPGLELTMRRITTSTDVAATAARSRPLARLAGALPALRTHLIAVGRVPR